jgi:DNA-binding transcriptional LysR family regulator
VASFSSVIGSLIPRAVAVLTDKHPGLQIGLTDTQPPEALELLRTGKIDNAIIFRYDDTEPEPPDVRLHHLLDDPLYLLALRAHRVKGIVDPPAATALLAALAEVAASIGDFSPTPDASPDAESSCPIVLPVLEGTSTACPISC